MADDGAVTASDPAGTKGTGVLWRALAVTRLVLLGYAVVVNAVHWQDYQRPALTWLVLGVLAAWSLAAPWLQREPHRRPATLVVELGLGVGALLLTPYVQGAAMLDPGTATLPSYWIAAPVLAWAIYWGWTGGLASALITGAVDVAVRVDPSSTTVGNVFLLVVTGLTAGYAASLVRVSTVERAEAAAAQAATAERERLSRAVHDGVLQTLSYVQRRGAEIGGHTAELAQLAAEQEEALRGLVRGTNDRGVAAAAGRTRDVAEMLDVLTSRTVSVATPGEPVPLPAHTALELVAAVRAALDNTARHAPGATAYVLLENEDDAVLVSVGDDGPGIPAGRLDEAAASGRLGVSSSITARLADVGGTAELTTAQGTGTEWELRVPHRVQSRP